MRQKEYQPLVSIIVFCYNHEKFVEECIMSMVNQTYDNIDLTVIDDASKDNSPQIIEKLAEKYGFRYVLNEKNMGWPQVLNFGICRFIDGKYFSICSGDDYYSYDKTKKQVDFLEAKNNYILVYGEKVLLQNDKKVYNSKPNKTHPRSGDLFHLVMTEKIQIFIQTALFRSELIPEFFPIPEGIWVEDKYLITCISKRHKIGYLSHYNCYYRLHPNNMSKDVVGLYDNIMRIIDIHKETSNYKKYKVFHALRQFVILSRHSPKAAIKRLPYAIQAFPSQMLIIGVFNLLRINLLKIQEQIIRRVKPNKKMR